MPTPMPETIARTRKTIAGTTDDVGARTRRERDDDADRLYRIRLGADRGGAKDREQKACGDGSAQLIRPRRERP